MPNIFESDTYRAYLDGVLCANRGKRGFQKRLAEAAGCTSSYLSQVVRTHVNLSADHAFGMARFLDLPEAETELFLAMVECERAASAPLKEHHRARIRRLRRSREDFATRFSKKERLGLQEEVEYYSRWQVAAAHMLTTVPSFRTAAAIASRLGMSPAAATAILESLQTMGLVRFHERRWHPSAADIHLPRTSILNATNHSVWRQRILAALQEGDPRNLNYTAVHTLSLEDVEKLKAMIRDFIDRTRALVAASPEEDLVCFACDLVHL